MAGAKGKGLGRGLESLFGDIEVQAGDSVQYVGINDIKPNSAQPRQVINEENIEELAASIKVHGVIQPIILKRAGSGFEIVAGERRWRAARKAGLKEVPGIVRELSDEQRTIVALIENIQREDLNPIEEAEAFQRMREEFGFTQEDVSRNVGKSRPYITNSLRLLKLPSEIKKMVLEGELTNGHARALINLENPKRQIMIAEKITSEGLSVREAEKLVREKEQKTGRVKNKAVEKGADILEIEDELKEIFGTKVTLKHNGKSGKLEFSYFSEEELERLIDIFRTFNEV